MAYIPPIYPSSIPIQTGTAPDLPDRVDDIDWLFAARYNELKKELLAIMTELGTLPKGDFADVKTRLDATGGESAISVHRNGDAQEIPNNTDTQIEWTTKEYDINDEYDESVNYRFTADEDGRYIIYANVYLLLYVDEKYGRTRILKNGNNVGWAYVYTSGATIVHIRNFIILELDANDWIEIDCRQGSGAAKDMDGSQVSSFFQTEKVA